MSGGDPYTYPDSAVLRNKFGITDAASLESAERELVTQRASEGIPSGRFDLVHLCAIHRHLFQDIYEWAGQLRTVEISKGGHQFQFRRYIETGFTDIHGRLERKEFLVGLSADDFAVSAAAIMGDLNYVHPFREGNGRAQCFYLSRLAIGAGFVLDITRLDPARWIAASRASHASDYDLMAEEIRGALVRLPAG